MQKRSLRAGITAVICALSFSSCGPPAARGPACWEVSPPAGGSPTASAKAARWIEILRTDDPSEYRAAHREAVAALAKLGPEAWAATGPLYLSLKNENAFDAAVEGSYVDAVTSSLAAISREKAVAQSLALFKASEGNDRAAARLIWGTVMRKVGADAVPCLCDLATSAEAPEVVAYYVMILQSLADHGALGSNKSMAHESITKLMTHADNRVREAATEALASF
jgi:hypothetical protein